MFRHVGLVALWFALLLSGPALVAPLALQAQTGALSFTPEQPRSGERIEVSYRPTATLAGEASLHLRARLRTPEHGSYNTGMGSVEVARLERGTDGVARGSFRLPADVVYAAFAVESPDGSRTDSREGRFWELLVSSDDGRPLLDALEQRFNDHMGRDMSQVLETARTMTRVYPEVPHAWTMLNAAENWGGETDDEEARAAGHRERLVEFHRTLRDVADLSSSQVAYMYWYARVQGSQDILGHWQARLLESHPGHFFAIQERINELNRIHADDPEAFLTELESLWEVTEDRNARERVLGPGLHFARQTGDPRAITLWTDRHVVTGSASNAWAATTLAGIEATRDEGIRRLRAVLPEVARAGDTERALGQTAAEHEASVATRVAGLRTTLGRALLAAGRADEAVAEFESAASVGWDVARLRNLSEARLASGDSAGAISAFAAVAADPATSSEAAEALRATAGATADAWAVEVQRARYTMLERTLATAREEEVGSPSARTPGGVEARLGDLLGPEATVVVFWSRYCGPSAAAMPRIAALARELADIGVPLLAVTRDPQEAAEEYLEEEGFELDVLFDVEGAMGRALNNWGTPQYYVLDGVGRLRFVSSLDALKRHTAALRGSL